MNIITRLLRKKEVLFVTIFLLIIISFIFFDLFNLDESIYFKLTGKHYYDVLFWENLNLGTIATLSAVLIALYSALKSIDLVHDQLKVEQQPLVVVENSIDIGGIDSGPKSQGDKYLLIKFKNIGRGPAVRITACLDRKNPDMPFFKINESHSFELGANAESKNRKIDEGILRQRIYDESRTPKSINKENPLYIHIYYRDQLGYQYHRKAKFFWENDLLKLMENKAI